jgi:Zn-dependent peptidase ImmA (M78 family)
MAMLNYVPTADVIKRRQADLPVDVTALARDFGIEVSYADLSDAQVAGKLVKDGERYRIVVNAADPPPRQRFTLAHEIAHYVLHRDLMGTEIADDAFYRSSLSSAEEIQANRLAAEILLPADQVKRAYAQTKALAPLAETFGVSTEALRIRLRQLGKAA